MDWPKFMAKVEEEAGGEMPARMPRDTLDELADQVVTKFVRDDTRSLQSYLGHRKHSAYRSIH
jgi:hypothetical protein